VQPAVSLCRPAFIKRDDRPGCLVNLPLTLTDVFNCLPAGLQPKTYSGLIDKNNVAFPLMISMSTPCLGERPRTSVSKSSTDRTGLRLISRITSPSRSPARRKGEWLYAGYPYQTIPWALVGTLAVGEEPARAGCAFSTLILAATLPAISRNAAARGEAGSVITIGSPQSPPILSRVSSGMLPRKGIPRSTAACSPPPCAKMSVRVPQRGQMK
jgi:hypothetical protein